MTSDDILRAITELDFKNKKDKRDCQYCEDFKPNYPKDNKELERSITMAFLVGIAFGFGSRYDEKDKILKDIREMIDNKEDKRR